jgi:hypothetical protein
MCYEQPPAREGGTDACYDHTAKGRSRHDSRREPEARIDMGCIAVTHRRFVSLMGAAGSSASIAAVIRPQDWTGFHPSGTHDNASIFRAMGTQVPTTGGIICFPAGRIGTSASCLLPSLTTVVGQGEPTEIICLPSFTPTWTVGPRAAFINRAWATGGGEAGITIRDLRLTGEAGPALGGRPLHQHGERPPRAR